MENENLVVPNTVPNEPENNSQKKLKDELYKNSNHKKMCIITQTVESVRATKIFSCFTHDESSQFLVYSNEVTTPSDNNLMILPVPNPDSVAFVNLKQYPKFFDHCEDQFERIPEMSPYASLSHSRSLSASYDSAPLPVHHVGSYLASIVPSIQDFERLNQEYFDIPDDLERLLGRQYNSEFGFIVCRLKKGNHTYHPFAYMHQKHSCGLLFLPTLHYHPHDRRGMKHIEADWDHLIYTVGTDYDSTSLDGYRYSPKGTIQYEKLPSEIRWTAKNRMCRRRIYGEKKNEDVWLAGNVYYSNSRSTTPPASTRTYTLPAPVSQTPKRKTYDFPFTVEGLERIRKHFNR